MMRIVFIALLCAMLFSAMPAEAKKSWVRAHYTKNGTHVSGHYTTHRSHISHAKGK